MCFNKLQAPQEHRGCFPTNAMAFCTYSFFVRSRSVVQHLGLCMTSVLNWLPAIVTMYKILPLSAGLALKFALTEPQSTVEPVCRTPGFLRSCASCRCSVVVVLHAACWHYVSSSKNPVHMCQLALFECCRLLLTRP